MGREMIGRAKIGDGTTLTEEQWVMNNLVEEHAKAAARRGRRSREEVGAYLGLMGKVAGTAGWIGRATHAANNG